MTGQEFAQKLDKIQQRNNKEIVALVHRARIENADGVAGTQAVDFASDPSWQRRADGVAESAGWIYDRLNGRGVSDKKNVATKIRKALGYSCP